MDYTIEQMHRRLNEHVYETKLLWPARSVAKDQYHKVIAEYHADQSRLIEKFRADALAAVGLAKHPKADKIFSYAWQEGHSAGMYEVFNVLVDLCELFDTVEVKA